MAKNPTGADERPHDAPDEWPSEWLRGVLGLWVLRALEAGPTYGYAITVQLAEAGLGEVKGGTLYPLLSRFESAGLVSVEWRPGERGPGRKFYRLTDAGHATLTHDAARWVRFATLTSAFITGTARTTTDDDRTPTTPIEVQT